MGQHTATLLSEGPSASLRSGAPTSHRLGWIRLGYGEMTGEFRVPSDHLESLHFAGTSTEISLVLMNICASNSDPTF